jgi:hypothetical protein
LKHHLEDSFLKIYKTKTLENAVDLDGDCNTAPGASDNNDSKPRYSDEVTRAKIAFLKGAIREMQEIDNAKHRNVIPY